MLLLLLAVQSAAAPTPPAKTLESETMDAYELSCTVSDSNWTKYRVGLLQKGGRAFTGSRDGESSVIFQTAVYSRITEDETGRLSSMGSFQKLVDRPGYGHANAPVEIGGDKGRATIKLAEVNARQYAVTIVQSTGADRNAFAGFCDVAVIAQSPLTEAETEAYVRDPYSIP